MKSVYDLDVKVISDVDVKSLNNNNRMVLRTLNLKDMSFADKKDAIEDVLELELGCVPKELTIGRVNQYRGNTDKIIVNVSFLSRQRAFEDANGIFPIGYLLKTVCDEYTQKCQRTFLTQTRSIRISGK